MRVLYVAHYRENSGWGEAARNYILALDKVGVDVVCRPILFRNNAVLPDRIKELEAKSGGGFDYCIQNVLPHYMENNGRYKKNIGQYVEDTINIRYTSWYPKLNMMDALFGTKSTQDTITDNKYYHVPHCFDISVYEKEYKKLDIPHIDGKYVFYYIGEFNRRKNISAMLRAFHSTFNKNDNVALILKVNKPGVDPNTLGEEINGLATTIKKHLGKYSNLDKYQNEIVIPFDLPREDILRLHKTGNCFITTSYGEGWCIPAFESVMMNNSLIASYTEPFTQYSPEYDLLYDSTKQPLVGADKIFPGFGSSREYWNVPDVGNIITCLTMAPMLNKIISQKPVNKELFSYETVGKTMMEALND